MLQRREHSNGVIVQEWADLGETTGGVDRGVDADSTSAWKMGQRKFHEASGAAAPPSRN